MSKRWLLSLSMTFSLYLFFFIQVDAIYTTDKNIQVNLPIPAVVQRIVHPYLNQLASELLYVKTVVYISSTLGYQRDFETDITIKNFEVMQSLHPYFFDAYNVANAHLPPKGASYAKQTNAILKEGIPYFKSDWRFPFFIAYNNFFYLKNNAAAYDYLLRATELSGNYFFTHLASVLMVKGGELKTATAWLTALYDTETNEINRKSILRDIAAYKAALQVEEAVKTYYAEKGAYPVRLKELIPGYLQRMPEIEANFEVVYDGQGGVTLQRPYLNDIKPN